jgi:anti-anti-sigma factor
MSVECLNNGSGEVVYKFNGRMNLDKCTKCEDKIETTIQGAKKVIFDLANVDFVSSAFLRLCGRAAAKVIPGNFRIINVKPIVNKVFKISGLSDYVDC